MTGPAAGRTHVVKEATRWLGNMERGGFDTALRGETALGRRIDVADRQIDEYAYELSGLTGEEIRIVGEATTHG